jgi:hypothetical protein
MPRQLPAEITFDELDADPSGYQIVTSKAMPFFSNAESNVEVFHRSDVYGWDIFFASSWWVDRKKTSIIQKLREVIALEFGQHC